MGVRLSSSGMGVAEQLGTTIPMRERGGLRFMRNITLLGAAFAISCVGVGCDGGAADRLDNRWDCKQICDRFAECVTDDDYDVDDCAKECRDNANSDDDFESKVDNCENCLDDRDSCAEDTVQCADECTGVVLQSQ
jgi:hypothetical protein